MPGRQARTRTCLRVDVFCSGREGASARERGAGVAAAEREDGGGAGVEMHAICAGANDLVGDRGGRLAG